MTDVVRTEVRNGVLTITLDRPKANAIDVATSGLLYAAFETLQNDPALRVAIITGASRVEQVHDNFKALEALPKLTPDVMKQIDEAVA